MEEIINLIAEKKFSLVTEILDEINSVDIANFLETLDNDRLLIVFRLLKTDAAAEVFSYVSPEKQREIIESASDKEITSIVNELFIDEKNTQVRKAGKARADKQISPLSRQKRWLDNDARVSRPQGGHDDRAGACANQKNRRIQGNHKRLLRHRPDKKA